MVLDVGLKNKEEIIKAGIEVGQMVLPKTPFMYSHNQERVFAKAVDDRWGVGMALN